MRAYAAEKARQEEPPTEAARALERWYDWLLGRVEAAAQVLNPEMLRLPPRAGQAPDPHAASEAAQHRFADHRAALAWLDAERENLIAAVRHAAAEGPAEVGFRIADGLRGYFWLRMHLLDWVEVATAGLAAGLRAGDSQGQAAALLSLGDAYGRQGRYRQALDYHRRALELHQQTGWVDGQAASLGSLGNVCWWAGDLPEAADYYLRALALAQRTGRIAGQAVNLGNLGAVYWDLGELDRSAEHHRRALELDRRLSSPLGEAVDLGNLARIELERGHPERARDQLERALQRHREIGDRAGEAEALRLLAETQLALGQADRACRLAESAVEVAAGTGSARYEADARNTLGGCARRLGRTDRAVAEFQRALALATDSGSRYPRIAALIGLAEVAPEPRPACAYARRALALARQSGYRLLEAYAQRALAGAHARSGDASAAATARLAAQALFAACGSATRADAWPASDPDPAATN